MFLGIGILLVLLWLGGFLVFHTAGLFIHILLVLAIVSIVLHFWRGNGGIVGALVGMGIPEYEAKRFEGAVKEGGVPLSVHFDTSDEITRAKEEPKRTGARNKAASGVKASGSESTSRWEHPDVEVEKETSLVNK